MTVESNYSIAIATLIGWLKTIQTIDFWWEPGHQLPLLIYSRETGISQETCW